MERLNLDLCVRIAQALYFIIKFNLSISEKFRKQLNKTFIFWNYLHMQEVVMLSALE